MKDFFISYNKADRAWAEWIAYQLEDANYSTISQAWDFLAGGNFVLDMHKASQEAEHTIAVLSPDYLNPKAGFSQSEWAAAFKEDPTGERGKLLLVRVRECETKGLLGPITYIDFVGLDQPKAREKLLAEVRRERRKPMDEPPFPPSITPIS
jgi:hypothetical protein